MTECTSTCCPAYPEKGRDCLKVAGTDGDMGRYEPVPIEEKVDFCRKCDYYIKYAHKF